MELKFVFNPKQVFLLSGEWVLLNLVNGIGIAGETSKGFGWKNETGSKYLVTSKAKLRFWFKTLFHSFSSNRYLIRFKNLIFLIFDIILNLTMEIFRREAIFVIKDNIFLIRSVYCMKL